MEKQLAEGQPIGQDEIRAAMDTLRKYKDGKASLEARIVENEKWYRLRHWDAVGRAAQGDAQPASAWLFNTLANKHADMMDSYPSPNVLPREQSDEQDAKSLSSILPVVLERNDFEGVYSDACWYKLKNGACAYGVFWDAAAENGLGDIALQNIDLLNLFWEPGKADIQSGRNLFIVSPVDDDLLAQSYPEQAAELQTNNRTIDLKEYVYDDAVDTTGKSLVVDWYYKRQSVTGANIVHFCKFCGDTLLYASENDPEYQEVGFYSHGLYPVVIDRLFPIEGAAVGFGYIDIAKDPQLYIDRLDADILRNADLAGKPRWFVRDDGAVNEAEFADFRKSFVHVAGRLDEESLRQVRVEPMPAFIAQHRQSKIDEMKETAGNRDFSQGGSSGGVTAASAIAALQETGNKLSRDALKGSYRAFTKLCNLLIELSRQFYDEERAFRITGEDGQAQYIRYSNAGLREQVLPPAYPGEEQEPDYAPQVRRPIFDISIKAQRANPFNRISQNELAKELYGAGFFDPQRADMALMALDIMDFEGKSKVVEGVRRSKTLYDMVMEQRQTMDKMAAVIGQVTGTPLQETAPQGGAGGQTPPSEQAQQRAARNAQGAAQQRIAEGAPV